MIDIPDGSDAICARCCEPYMLATARLIHTPTPERFCSGLCEGLQGPASGARDGERPSPSQSTGAHTTLRAALATLVEEMRSDLPEGQSPRVAARDLHWADRLAALLQETP